MQAQTAVVLGASGLIGSHVLQLLLDDPTFIRVRVLVRKQLDTTHDKLEVAVVDFNDLSDFKNKIGQGDSIFCCVGTTMKKMKGDKVAYRKVDYDIPVNAARFCAEAGFRQYLLVSSVGANPSSGNFYLQLKGEVEKAVTTLPFKSVHIFQPSMLLGDRKEFRMAELIGKKIMGAVSFLFAGAIKKYKPVHAGDVANAMVAAAKLNNEGVTVYQYDEMMELIQK